MIFVGFCLSLSAIPTLEVFGGDAKSGDDDAVGRRVVRLDAQNLDLGGGSLTVDVGTVLYGKVSEFKLPLVNRADQDISIETVESSCGCTATESSEGRIKAGQRRDFAFRILKTKTGKFSVELRLNCAHGATWRLMLEGKVRRDFEFSPSSLVLGAGPVTDRRVKLTSYVGDAFTESTDMVVDGAQANLVGESVVIDPRTVELTFRQTGDAQPVQSSLTGAINVEFKLQGTKRKLRLPFESERNLVAFPRHVLASTNPERPITLYLRSSGSSAVSEAAVRKVRFVLGDGVECRIVTPRKLESFKKIASNAVKVSYLLKVSDLEQLKPEQKVSIELEDGRKAGFVLIAPSR